MRIRFVLRETLTGLTRNATMTAAMIITTAISLALLATGILITNMTQETKEIYLDRVEVMVQLTDSVSRKDTDCSSKECSDIKEQLDNDPAVSEVKFRNQQQSYERFTQLFKDSDPELVAQTTADSLPAALHIRLQDPTNIEPIQHVEDMPGVANVVDQVDDLRGATRNLDAIRNASFVLAAIQAIAAVFLIMNMVQIAAYSRRDEMSIMRMVGASHWYTHAPFILEAIFASLIGSCVAVLGMFAGKIWVLDSALKSLYDANLIARVNNSDIWFVAPGIVIVGALIAAITAEVTLRFYVKK